MSDKINYYTNSDILNKFPILEQSDKTMILFIGIQASGKTTFYNNFFKNKYEHINLDTLHTRNKERIAIEQCIALEKSFVVDNTNPKKIDRERYIQTAKEHNYRILGCYFKSSISECVNRNENRAGKAKVPTCAIAATSNKLELPDYGEGFDKIYYVRIEGTDTIIEDWRTDT